MSLSTSVTRLYAPPPAAVPLVSTPLAQIIAAPDDAATSAPATVLGAHSVAVRSAAASIVTGVAVILAVFSAALYLQNPVSAMLLATGITVGAAAAVWRLQFHLRSMGAWLSALGGVILLIVGGVLAVAQHSGVARLHTAMINSWTLAVPFAAVIIIVGGFLQLPRVLAPWVVLITGGLVAATWATIDLRFEPAVIWVGALVAVFAAVQCLFQFSGRHSRQHHRRVAAYSAHAALVLVIVVAVSEIMVSVGVGELKPALLLWELTIIAFLGVVSAWTMTAWTMAANPTPTPTSTTTTTTAAVTPASAPTSAPADAISGEDPPVTRRYSSGLLSHRRLPLADSTVR